MLLGTVLIAVVALGARGAGRRSAPRCSSPSTRRLLRRPLTSLVDLLAAVPSLIYGLWGRAFLQPGRSTSAGGSATHLGFIPFFRRDKSHGLASYPSSTFIAGLVVALMIVPICTAVMREVFSQAPPGEKEGALALGGTKWGVIGTWCSRSARAG